MEQEIKNLNEFVGEIRQILPLLATKEDLKRFATKEDLEAFATKEDLKAFATKEDLKAFATKEELRAAVAKLATKDELREEVADARRYALMLNEATRDDIRLLAEHMVAMQAQLSGMQAQLGRIERRLP